jgi:hypothetical protein
MINHDHNDEGIALVLGFVMGIAYFLINVTCDANAAPRWRTGYPTALGLPELMLLYCLLS